MLPSVCSSGWRTQPAAEETLKKTYKDGETALQRGNLDEAEREFRKVLDLSPQDLGARVNLGVISMRRQQWQRALEYLGEAERMAPAVAGIHLNVALVHYRQGNYAKAIPDFEATLKYQPDSSQAERLLGLCYLFTEHYAEATAQLKALWPSSNGDVSYLYSLAVAAGNSGDAALAERASARLLEIGSDGPLVHLLAGKAFMSRQDYEDALAELEIAERGDTKLPMLHYNLGIVYRHKGDLTKAQSEFLKDVSLEPDVAYNYDQLGTLASLDGHESEAESNFLQAVSRDPTLGTSWFGLAKVYKQQKRYADALRALDKASSVDPNSASVHYLRAQVLVALERQSEARTEFATVQRLKKESVDKLEEQVSGTQYMDPELTKQK